MKKTFIYTLFFALLGASLFMSNSSGRANGGGGNATTSGCGGGSCHNGGNWTAKSTLTIQKEGKAVTSYVPGQVYDVAFTVEKSGGTGNPTAYGFQLTSIDGGSKSVGTFAGFAPAADIRTSTLGARTFVEHNKASSANVFKMTWTAPAKGTGAVAFLAAGNSVNKANGQSGDVPGGVVRVDLTENTISTYNLPSWATDLKVTPNPVADIAMVKVTLSAPISADLKVYDLSGKNLMQSPQQLQAGENFIPLEINHLATGTYIISVVSKGESISKRIVKF